jgi:NIMA (never in mitosis gene a)-related kinase
MDLSRMTEQERKETRQEARILEILKHPSIINFREVFTTVTNKLCIVMDYADGGDLQKKIKEAKGRFFAESQILDWLTQICLGLKHVHDRKILHRDIKLQNIFMTKTNRCLLGDFGIAKILSCTKGFARTVVGTPYYLSPEILESKNYSFQSDIWSLGILLYELCALKPPFDAPNLPLLGMRIVRGNYTPLSSQYSRELRNLVSQMLMVDPNKRPTIHQILKMGFIKARVKSF